MRFNCSSGLQLNFIEKVATNEPLIGRASLAPSYRRMVATPSETSSLEIGGCLEGLNTVMDVCNTNIFYQGARYAFLAPSPPSVGLR